MKHIFFFKKKEVKQGKKECTGPVLKDINSLILGTGDVVNLYDAWPAYTRRWFASKNQTMTKRTFFKTYF